MAGCLRAQGHGGGARSWVRHGSQLSWCLGLRWPVPELTVAVCYVVGQRGHCSVAGSWGFSACVPPCLPPRPGRVALSGDVLSGEELCLPPTLGCDRCTSSVIGVGAEEPSVVLLPCAAGPSVTLTPLEMLLGALGRAPSPSSLRLPDPQAARP